MKNLKKFLSLALTLALLAGFVSMPAMAATPGEGAPTGDATAGYSDYDLTATFDGTTYKGEGPAITDPAKTPKLNLMTETLDLGGFTVKGYSVNGGSKWIAGSPDAAAIVKMLDKGGELWLTDTMNGKVPLTGNAADAEAKIVEKAGAAVYKFRAVAKRATTPKVVVNYGIYKNEGVSSDGMWTLTSAGKESLYTDDTKSTYDAELIALMDSLQTVAAGTDGKLPAKVVWSNLFNGETYGNELPAYNEAAKKPGAAVYFYRQAPTKVAGSATDATLTAGSKVKKVKVSSVTKEVAAKFDLKKNVVKAKKGSIFEVGIVDTNVFSSIYEGTIDDTAAKGLALAAAADATADTGTMAKSGWDFYGKTWKSRIDATVKKPASKVYTIEIPAQALLADGAAKFEKNTFKMSADFLAKYEVETSAGKWGKPKISKSAKPESYPVRLKNTAVFDKTKGTFSKEAISATGTLYITYGTYMKGTKEVECIVDAYIVGDGKGDAARAWDKVATESEKKLIRSITLDLNPTAKLSTADFYAEVIVGGTAATEPTAVIGDEDVATIEFTGVKATVTAVDLGSTTITMKANEFTYTINVTVIDSREPSAAPVISAQPASASVAVDGTLVLSVTATPAACTYQWFSVDSDGKEVEIDKAINATYTVPTEATGTFKFFCRVTNTESGKLPTSVDSTVATITVREAGTDASVTGIIVKGVAATGADLAYTVELPEDTDLSKLTAADIDVTATDSNATVGTAEDTSAGTDGSEWTVTVTAEDGVTVKSYVITVTVALPEVED